MDYGRLRSSFRDFHGVRASRRVLDRHIYAPGAAGGEGQRRRHGGKGSYVHIAEKFMPPPNAGGSCFALQNYNRPPIRKPRFNIRPAEEERTAAKKNGARIFPGMTRKPKKFCIFVL